MTPGRRLVIVVGMTAVVAAIVWFAATSDSGGSRTFPPDDSPAPRHPLLRPLAQRVDARFAGKLRVPARRGVLAGGGPNEERILSELERAAAEALRANPADAGAALDFAARMLWLGFWPTGEEVAGQVLAVDPGDARAKAVLAAVRSEQGRRTESETLAREALAVEPNLPLALVCRARLLAARGSLDQALADLQLAAAVDPLQPAAAFWSGSLLFEANRFEQAAPWFARARDFLPDPEFGKGSYIAVTFGFVELLGGRQPYRARPRLSGSEAPMQLLPLPVVRGSLTGMGRTLHGSFVLDCGATLTVLGREAAALARSTGTEASVLTVAGVTAKSAGLLERITIGDLEIHDVPVLLDHGEREPHAPGVLAQLGTGLLRNFRVTLDVPGGRCRLEPPDAGAAAPPPVAEVPFELVSGQIIVRGRFAGGPERTFTFDTGASALFVSPEVLAQEFGPLPGRPMKQVALGGVDAEVLEVPLPRPFVFGGRPVPLETVICDPDVALRNASARLENAGTLGLVIRARYVFDFARQRLLLYDP